MSDSSTSVSTSGISLGSAIAVTISWSLYKSIVWAIIQIGRASCRERVYSSPEAS